MKSQCKNTIDVKVSSVDAAMDYLLRLLTTRERSIQEARKRLKEKGYKDQTISYAVERALACGLLDDQRFARGYIKGKLSAGWGKRRIEQGLFQFGIVAKNIAGYPDEYFAEEEQLERALLALKRHHTRAKNPRQAAYRFLVNRGYGSDIAAAAIKATADAEELG